jgi:hypothetical protein
MTITVVITKLNIRTSDIPYFRFCLSPSTILITSAIRRTSRNSLSNGQDTNYNCIHIFRVALEDTVSKTSFLSYYSYKLPLDSFNVVTRLESEININHSELHAYSSLLISLFL